MRVTTQSLLQLNPAEEGWLALANNIDADLVADTSS